MLERRNNKARDVDDSRQLAAYRQYVKSRAGTADVVIIGHIHRPFDEADSSPRLIVPGGWFGQSSYVRVDAHGAALFVEKDPTSITC
jgi:UDP-2,3-diacylglucosamine hydrolase